MGTWASGSRGWVRAIAEWPLTRWVGEQMITTDESWEYTFTGLLLQKRGKWCNICWYVHMFTLGFDSWRLTGAVSQRTHNIFDWWNPSAHNLSPSIPTLPCFISTHPFISYLFSTYDISYFWFFLCPTSSFTSHPPFLALWLFTSSLHLRTPFPRLFSFSSTFFLSSYSLALKEKV